MNRREFFSLAVGMSASVFLMRPHPTGFLFRNGNLYSVRDKS